MWCYFRRGGHFDAVEFVKAESDADAIEQGKVRFRIYAHAGFDDFEVRDGQRVVYRYQATTDKP
jgi:hypothetical protein